MQRESMDYDLLIVGGGPAGLAAALRARQAAQAAGADISIALVEKGAAIGAHALSGALLDPRTMDELLPGWRDLEGDSAPPLESVVTGESLCLLSSARAFRIPNWSLPKLIRHDGHILISLNRFAAWLGKRAEAAGVDLFTGFAAAQPLYADDSQQSPLVGVVTGDFGVDRQGNPKPNYQPGVELRARYTLLAEGCRGHLSRLVEERFQLRNGVAPQKYGLGFRELWWVPAEQHHPGKVVNLLGWPLAGRARGGGFIYHLRNQCVAVGMVIHLDYENPSLSPFDEFQRFKTHPLLKSLLHGGERLGFGARTLTGGGVQSLPKLAFPGGALIGEAAGLANLPRMQGIHTSMKSALAAAEAAVNALRQNRAHDTLHEYDTALRASWAYDELHAVRNIKPCLQRGFVSGLLRAGLHLWVQQFGLGLSRTLPHTMPDHRALRPAAEMPVFEYPPYDHVTSFDRASSTYFSRIQFAENQPCHLHLIDPELPARLNLPQFGGPERLYCPAGVYEYHRHADGTPPTLVIHAAGCLHCKACDIKDPSLNIRWSPPEGGSGPYYVM